MRAEGPRSLSPGQRPGFQTPATRQIPNHSSSPIHFRGNIMRPFAFALFALVFASPAIAADPVPAPAAGADAAPEKLLPPSTQLYVRWDGVTAHNDAYKKSVWGGIMAGPTGDNVRALLAKAPKLLGSSVLAEP